MPGDNPDPNPGMPVDRQDEIGPAPGTDAQDVTEEPDTQPSVEPKPDTKTPAESNAAEAFEPDDPEEI